VLAQAATTGRTQAAQLGARTKRLFRAASRTLGFHRGNRRLYIDGQYLLSAGFAPGRYILADFQPNRVVLRLSSAGGRLVSSKAAGRTPVIDINCRELTEALGSVETVVVKVMSGEIVITPTVREERRRTRCRNGMEGSLCSGGGLLSAAARLAGFEPAFAVEVDPRYADVYESNFPNSTVFNMPLEELDVRDLPPVEILTMGLDCSGVSLKRSLDRGTGKKRDRALPPEAHPTAGVLPLFAAAVIEHTNPRLVVIEEGKLWLNSASGYMMRFFLERLGYKVEGRIIDGRDYGYLQMRARSVMIGTTDDSPRWPLKRPCEMTLADVLDSPEAVESLWFDETTKGYLFRHWQRSRERGNNFAPRPLTPDAGFVQGVSKRYLSCQGDGQVLAHPTDPKKRRFFSLAELRRLFTVPEGFNLGEERGVTVAGEVLGQGVIIDLFKRIIRAAAGRGGADVEPREQEEGAALAQAGQLAFGF
jgi:DNA (cytosine-5)-methyltransferase 1